MAPNLTGKVPPAIRTFESRFSVPVRNIPKAPKVSTGANLSIEAPKIGSLLLDLRSWILLWQVLWILLTRSSTYSSAVRSVSKFPPEVGKQTAKGRIKSLKTSDTTNDKFSRSSSEVGILHTKIVALGSVNAQSIGAHKIMDSTVASDIEPAPNIDKDKTE